MSICFHNNGKLDRRAFTMMGLSAKTDDKAIGMFGTGFKYAIATLLRNGCSVEVHARGTYSDVEYTMYKFDISTGKFRDKKMDFITCIVTHDGEEVERFELPFTTHLGVNWKMWQAYRELYTNALDEGGGVCTDDVMSLNDVCIYVTGDEFEEIYKQHDKYFINPTRPTVAASHRMRCLDKVEGSDNVVYYKSMYTGTQLEKPSLLTYDYILSVELTEDRTLADTWYIKNHITSVWVTAMKFDTLVEYLPKASERDVFEHDLDDNHYEKPSEDFLRACKYLVEHRRTLPLWAHQIYLKTRPFDEQINHYKLTKFQRKKLEHAIGVLRHHECIVDIDLIVTCVSLPEDLLGMFKDGVIYLSKELFDKGEMIILGTVYEEWMHMYYNCDDCTRKMQNLLVDRVAILMEQLYDIESDVA